MLPHQKLSVAVDYNLYGKLENQVREREITVLDTAFTELVTVTLGVPVAEVQAVRDWLVDLSNGQALVTPGEEYYSFVRGK